MKKEQVCWLSLFGGAFFAVCMIMGMVFYPNKGLSTDNSSVLGVFIPAGALLTGIFYYILHQILHREYTYPTCLNDSRPSAFFRRHVFSISFFILLAGWAPYCIMCYPGSASYDICRQFEIVLGIKPMINKHPVMSTLLLGLAFHMGSGVSDTFGVFTVVLCQTLMNAAVIALCVRKILTMTDSVRFSAAVLSFFALNPLWGLYQQTLTKDVPFYGLFLLYCLFYIELAEQVLYVSPKTRFSWKTCIYLALSGTFCCLMRHGEVIIILISGLLLAACAIRDKWKTAVLFVATAAMAVGGSRMLVSIYHADSFPTRAIFSIFFQQTALYMKKYPEDITAEQYQAIDAVLDADAIADLYDPLLSDPVKGTYKQNVGRTELVKYFKAWFQMFFRHPAVYFDSFFNFASTYLDPFHLQTKRIFYICKNRGDTFDGLDVQYKLPRKVRKSVRKFAAEILEVPILPQFIYPGTYVWVCTVCFLLLWHKHRCRQMAVFSLPFLRLLMCIASPAAGYIRYTLPLLAITPLMMAWACANAAAADQTGAFTDKNKT